MPIAKLMVVMPVDVVRGVISEEGSDASLSTICFCNDRTKIEHLYTEKLFNESDNDDILYCIVNEMTNFASFSSDIKQSSVFNKGNKLSYSVSVIADVLYNTGSDVDSVLLEYMKSITTESELVVNNNIHIFISSHNYVYVIKQEN